MGGGSAVWKLPERSGGSFQTALREFPGGLIGEGGMRALQVVVLPVAFAQHFCFQQGGKGLPVEELSWFSVNVRKCVEDQATAGVVCGLVFWGGRGMVCRAILRR